MKRVLLLCATFATLGWSLAPSAYAYSGCGDPPDMHKEAYEECMEWVKSAEKMWAEHWAAYCKKNPSECTVYLHRLITCNRPCRDLIIKITEEIASDPSVLKNAARILKTLSKASSKWLIVEAIRIPEAGKPWSEELRHLEESRNKNKLGGGTRDTEIEGKRTMHFLPNTYSVDESLGPTNSLGNRGGPLSSGFGSGDYISPFSNSSGRGEESETVDLGGFMQIYGDGRLPEIFEAE